MPNRLIRRSEADEQFYRQWSLWHPWCQFCGISARQAVRERWPGLSTHHIVHGTGRSHEACCLLRACRRCHDLAELLQVKENGILWPVLTMAICLTVKKVREPRQWNPGRLAELYGRPLPPLQSIPALVEAEFRRRQPGAAQLFQPEPEGVLPG